MNHDAFDVMLHFSIRQMASTTNVALHVTLDEAVFAQDPVPDGGQKLSPKHLVSFKPDVGSAYLVDAA